MRIIQKIARMKIMRDPKYAHKLLPKLLEYYPPFWIMGVQVKNVSEDFREVEVRLPLRWYAKNTHGTMFGGYMCAVSDPIAAIMCGELFRGHGVESWTKAHSVTFLKPGRTVLTLKIKITDEDMQAIQAGLDQHQKVTHTFEFYFTDKAGVQIARVHNTVFLRMRAASRAARKAEQRPE